MTVIAEEVMNAGDMIVADTMTIERDDDEPKFLEMPFQGVKNASPER